MERAHVEQALTRLKERGESPTYDNIIAELGSGSRRDLAAIMRALRDGAPPELTAAPVRAAMAEIRGIMTQLAPLGTLLQEWESIDALYDYLATALEPAVDATTDALSQLQAEIAEAERQKETLEGHCRRLGEEYEHLHGRLSELRRGVMMPALAPAAEE